jgi:hypothetical protein
METGLSTGFESVNQQARQIDDGLVNVAGTAKARP